MLIEMEKPAFRGRANPVVLAGASNELEFIKSLPPIQQNWKAERRFALKLSARVFGPATSVETKTEKSKTENPVWARRFKTLTAAWNYSPEVARLVSRDEKMWRAFSEYHEGPTKHRAEGRR